MTTASSTVPEPRAGADDPVALALTYLDFFRGEVARKVSSLTPEVAARPCAPSGWTPLGLVAHLRFMERRWLEWGVAGVAVRDPWGDHVDGDQHGVWRRPDPSEAEALLAALHRTGDRSRTLVAGLGADATAATGGRFAHGSPPPTVLSVLGHVVQEYARHVGHLDLAVELAGGPVGEDDSEGRAISPGGISPGGISPGGISRAGR